MDAGRLLSQLNDGVALVAHTERVREHQEEAMHLVRVVGHQAEVTHTRFTELHEFKNSDRTCAAVADLPHKSRGRRQRPSDRPVSNQVHFSFLPLPSHLGTRAWGELHGHSMSACSPDIPSGG